MSYYFVSNIKSLQINSIQTERLFSMRVEKGHKVNLTDLNGTVAKVKIINLNKKQLIIDYEILEENFLTLEEYWSKTNKLNLFQATLDKLYMEKLFEILPHSDFRNIYFFEAEFSQKQNVNLERLNKILIRSLEQSQSLYKPQISFIKKTKLLELISQHNPTFLNCQTKNGLTKTNAIDSYLIGPEGGWSQKEVELFKQLNLKELDLGARIYPAWLVSNKL